jgi:peptidoglycan hydrolase CwlO-like protein
MTDFNSVLISILIICGIGLIGFAVYVLFRVVKVIDATKQEITELNHAVVPMMEKVATMVEEAKVALSVLSDNREEIGEVVSNIRQVTQNIARVEHLIFDKIEPSLVGLAGFLSGLNKGARTFVEIWRRSHS